MTQWRIRPATLDDVVAIAEVHIQAWRETYVGLLPDEVIAIRTVLADRIEMWDDILRNQPEVTVYVGESDGKLVGFACAGPPRDDEAPVDYEFWMLYTLQSMHGSGLGQALTDAVLGDRATYLWVVVGNDRAMSFYRRNGFIIDFPLASRHDTDVRMVRLPQR